MILKNILRPRKYMSAACTAKYSEHYGTENVAGQTHKSSLTISHRCDLFHLYWGLCWWKCIRANEIELKTRAQTLQHDEWASLRCWAELGWGSFTGSYYLNIIYVPENFRLGIQITQNKGKYLHLTHKQIKVHHPSEYYNKLFAVVVLWNRMAYW